MSFSPVTWLSYQHFAYLSRCSREITPPISPQSPRGFFLLTCRSSCRNVIPSSPPSLAPHIPTWPGFSWSNSTLSSAALLPCGHPAQKHKNGYFAYMTQWTISPMVIMVFSSRIPYSFWMIYLFDRNWLLSSVFAVLLLCIRNFASPPRIATLWFYAITTHLTHITLIWTKKNSKWNGVRYHHNHYHPLLTLHPPSISLILKY